MRFDTAYDESSVRKRYGRFSTPARLGKALFGRASAHVAISGATTIGALSSDHYALGYIVDQRFAPVCIHVCVCATAHRAHATPGGESLHCHDGLPSEDNMNRDRFEGACRQIAGSVRARWSALTGDESGRATGERDQRAGQMQVRCGMLKERLDRQLRDFLLRHRDLNHPDSPGRR